MSAVVVSAAVAGRQNERGSMHPSFLVNAFKRQWRQTFDESIAQEPPRHSQTESPETRPIEESVIESHGGGSNGEPSDREVRGEARRESNPVSTDALAGPFPVSGEGQQLTDSEIANAYVDDYEVYLLTPTPYGILVRQFALVPITSFATLLALILLLHGVWSPETWSSSFTSYLGFFSFAGAAWIVSFTFRIPLYSASSMVCHLTPALTPFFSTLVQVLCEEVLRLVVLILGHLRLGGTLHPSDPSFPRLWIMAIGWATVEVVVSVWQGYEQLALYKDVLSPAYDAVTPSPRPYPISWILEEGTTRPDSDASQDRHVFEDSEDRMHDGIDQLTRVRARLELEEVYGIPVPNIPVFISCLQRIDSIILSLALFLHMSSSYLVNLSRQSVPHLRYVQAIQDTIPVFLIIVILHTFLSFIWSASILPRIGVHSASYTGLVLSLGTLFAGLGRWNAL